MSVYVKHVLLSEDKHIKALVDKKDYPEAVQIQVQPFDLQEFNNNPYVYTVRDGVYTRDYAEDSYRKELEKKVADLTNSNLELVKQNKESNSIISGLMQQIAELQVINGGSN